METKIAVLAGVREYSEGEAVELWFNDKGRIVVRAYNEGGCCATDVDLFDLLSSVGVPKIPNDKLKALRYQLNNGAEDTHGYQGTHPQKRQRFAVCDRSKANLPNVQAQRLCSGGRVCS